MTTYQPPIPPPYQPQPQPGPYYGMPQQRKRPIGVTILAILEILGGILFLVMALAMFALAALINTPDFMSQLGSDVPQWLIDSGPTLFAVMGVVILIFALVAFLLAWGFLKGKRWARTVGIIFAILQIISVVGSTLATGAISGFASLGVSIIIPILILIYLMMASTKAWFTQ